MTPTVLHLSDKQIYYCFEHDYSHYRLVDASNISSVIMADRRDPSIVAIDNNDTSCSDLNQLYFDAHKISAGSTIQIYPTDDDSGILDGVYGVITKANIETGAVEVDIIHPALCIFEKKTLPWYWIHPIKPEDNKAEYIESFVWCVNNNITMNCQVKNTSMSENNIGTITSIFPLTIKYLSGYGEIIYSAARAKYIKKHIGKYVVYDSAVLKVIDSSDEANIRLQSISGGTYTVSIGSVVTLDIHWDEHLDYIFSNKDKTIIYIDGYYSLVTVTFIGRDSYLNIYINVNPIDSIINIFSRRILKSGLPLTSICTRDVFCLNELNINDKRSISKIVRCMYKGYTKLEETEELIKSVKLAKAKYKHSLQNLIGNIYTHKASALMDELTKYHYILSDITKIEADIEEQDTIKTARENLLRDVLFLANQANEFDDRAESIDISFVILSDVSFINFGIKTSDITLEYNSLVAELGPMEINITIKITDTFSYVTTVCQHESSGIDSIDGYFHPHVSTDGSVCFGNHDEDYCQNIDSGNIIGALDILLGILNTYNYKSPYLTIDEWDEDHAQCSECNSVHYKEEMHACDDYICDDCTSTCYCCGDKTICNQCGNICGECENSVCNSCIDECRSCHKYICHSCSLEADCGHLVCSNCVNTCPSCEDKICDDCICYCDLCSKVFCGDCVQICDQCDKRLCAECLEEHSCSGEE